VRIKLSSVCVKYINILYTCSMLLVCNSTSVNRAYTQSKCQPSSQTVKQTQHHLDTRTTESASELCLYWPAYWASSALLAGVCRRLSSVTLLAGRQAAERVVVGRPTFHGGPVRLRSVRATPCLTCFTQLEEKRW